MNGRRVATLILLPTITLLHALVGFSARSAWWRLIIDGEGDPAIMGIVYGLAALVGAGAAAAAAALGRGGTALSLGLLAAAVGNGLVVSGAPMVGAAVATAGRAMVAVGAGATAAGLFATASARLAALVAIYATINAGALLAPPLSEWVIGGWGANALLVAAVIALAVLFLLSLPVADIGIHGAAAEPRDSTLPNAAGAALAGGAASVVWSVGGDLQWSWLSAVDVADRWIYNVNPGAVLLASLVAIGVLVGCAVANVAVRPLWVAGAGLVLIGLGLLPTPILPGQMGWAAATAVMGLGEPLFYAGFWAAAAGGVHGRIAATLGAVVYAGSSLGGLISNAISRIATEPTVAGVLAAGAGGALVLLGAVAFVAGWFLGRTPEAEAEADPPPAAE